MAGRIGIDDVAPVVSGGRYPAKAVVGEVVPVTATVWREGHDAVAATLVVRYHGTAYPQLADGPAGLAPPSPPVPIEAVVVADAKVKPQASADVAGPDARRLPRPVHPRRASACGPSGSTAGATRSRRGARPSPPSSTRARANPNCPTTCSSARSCSSAPPPACRARTRYPLIDAAAATARAGRPVHPRGRRARRRGRPSCSTQYPLRELITRGEQYGVWVDRPLARFSAWYEIFPRSTGGWDGKGNPVHGTFATASEGAAAHREDGLRHRLPAADPPDRQGAPQGPQQQRDRRAQGRRLAVGDRQRQGRPRRGPPRSSARIEDFDDFVAAARDQGLEVALDLALQCAPDHPWAKDASRVVHRAARRHHRLRGEPAEEVPGHLPGQLRQRPGGHLRRGAARGPVLDRRTASRSSGSTTRTPSRRTSGPG